MRATIGRLSAAGAVVLLLAAGCSGDDDDGAVDAPDVEPTTAAVVEEPSSEEPTAPVDTSDTVDGDNGAAAEPSADEDELSAGNARALEFGEAFVDAFYNFERRTVQLAVINASETTQGLANYAVWWAEALGTEVVERFPCDVRGGLSVSCDVMVRDALTDTLGVEEASVVRWFIALNADGSIEEVRLIPDDPAELDAGYTWVIANRPGLFDDGDCAGFFAGGPTPVECASAVHEAFVQYAATLS